MSKAPSESGLAAIDGARIYYETAGEGDPFLMIHAGVAESRQWDREFAHFAQRYQGWRLPIPAGRDAISLPELQRFLNVRRHTRCSVCW